MKRFITYALILLFWPLSWITYTLGIAYIMAWIGWNNADEAVVNTKQAKEPRP